MSKALRKILAAIEGIRHRAVAIGALAHQAWGSKREAQSIELLTSSRPEQRDSLLSAARGEGFQQSPDNPLRIVYTDAKLGATVNVDLMEPSTPFHSQVISRSKLGTVLSIQIPIATCEDLILHAADRAVIVELLQANAGRIDGEYLKREAEAVGIFDEIKLAWKEAKEQG